MTEINTSETIAQATEKRFELLTALTLAFFATILAVTDLGGGKYGDDEIMGMNEKANVYSWYQSKSVKQSLLEGQRDLIRTLLDSGAIRQDDVSSLGSFLKELDEDIARYDKEKKELFLGSRTVGRENWVQDIDGELGKVTGAKEWESMLATLSRAGDRFDMSVLFLQLCLVIGAVSLVLKEARLAWIFYGAMVLSGFVGTVYAVQAFMIALSTGA